MSASMPLKGLRALVTSGPTHEPIDPVRYLGNRSSGRQGHAIAEALAKAGAKVTLVTGPVALEPPQGVKLVRVQTAREMMDACMEALPADIAVCAAAVSDWRVRHMQKRKMKKKDKLPKLELVENPDILKALSKLARKRPKLVIGFAAETESLLKNARAKLKSKRCDWIVANDVSGGKSFNAGDNEVILINRQAAMAWPCMSKQAVAERLVSHIITYLKEQKHAA